jgi:hypothetical protein
LFLVLLYSYGAIGTIIGKIHDLTENPLCIDKDLHVDQGSPAINSGAPPELFHYIPNADRVGTARPQGAGYDIGADETD